MFRTLLMGFYANRPFAIGPYMGETAFIAFTAVHVLAYTWQSALGAVFLAGILFILMTLFRLRQWMLASTPTPLRHTSALRIRFFPPSISLTPPYTVTLH